MSKIPYPFKCKGGFILLRSVLYVATESPLRRRRASVALRVHPIFFNYPLRQQKRTEMARAVDWSLLVHTLFTLYIVYFAH